MGKPLALAAIRRTAAQMRETAGALLDGPGTAYERISAYLLRERDVPRGCLVGRLAMDPDIIASDELRAPVDETIGRLTEWSRRAWTEASSPVAADMAATIAATMQGSYVLARASGSPEPPLLHSQSVKERGLRGRLSTSPGYSEDRPLPPTACQGDALSTRACRRSRAAGREDPAPPLRPSAGADRT